MKNRKSSLFANPGRVGKGDWERKMDRSKIGEALDRMFGERDPKDYQKGSKFHKSYGGISGNKS